MKWQGAGVNLLRVPFSLTSLARVENSLSMHPNSQDDTALSLSVATGKCLAHQCLFHLQLAMFMMEQFASLQKTGEHGYMILI
jgi:hypothetical protein